MAAFSIDLSELEGLGKDMARLSRSIRADGPRAKRIAHQGALLVQGAIQRSVRDTVNRATLKIPAASVRTGALMRSFKPESNTDAGAFTMGAASTLSYAKIQDEGGTILPHGRALAIPLNREAARRWPRDWPKGELFKVKKGGLKPGDPTGILARKKGSGFEAMYLLKRSVRVPAKNYIEKALEPAADAVAKLLVKEYLDPGKLGD